MHFSKKNLLNFGRTEAQQEGVNLCWVSTPWLRLSRGFGECLSTLPEEFQDRIPDHASREKLLLHVSENIFWPFQVSLSQTRLVGLDELKTILRLSKQHLVIPRF